MKKIALILCLILTFTVLFSETKITLGSKKYQLLDLYNGTKIEKYSNKGITSEITNLNFEKINIDSLLGKNKYSLVVFSTAYGIG